MKPEISYTTRLPPISLAGHKQLLLDDFCIEESRGLRRRLHQPARCGPVLTNDRLPGLNYVQTRDAPCWNPDKRLWEWFYWGLWECEPYGEFRSSARYVCHYAVSEDGVHWQKPALGLCAWRGSKQNNIVVLPESREQFLYHAFRDEHDSDPARRYKGFFGLNERRPACSPDGRAWTELGTVVPSGDESSCFYDPYLKEYACLVKHGTVWGRSMALTTSKDFNSWTDHGIVMHADDRDWDNGRVRLRRMLEDPRYLAPPLVDETSYMTEIYNMTAMPYEGLYVGLVNVFTPSGAIPPPQCNFTGINQVELAVSRDRLRWRRLCDRELFLAIQPWDGANYDTQQILPCGAPIVRDNEIWVYFSGIRFRGHKALYAPRYHPLFEDLGALLLGKLRLDGFVSLDADKKGFLITRPVRPDGKDLFVNVDAAKGALKAAVLDAETLKPLAGLSLKDSIAVRGDHLRAKLQWRHGVGLGKAAERPAVRIRFELERASLYAFWSE